MNTYVVFIKENESKAIVKKLVTKELKLDLKQQGFTRHHKEVEAENEKDAIRKLNEFSEGYLDSLKGLSGSAVICAISVIAIALIYFFRS